MDRIAIHCEPRIEWQRRRAPQMQAGLRAIGIDSFITNRRERQTYHAILLGTTCWRNIEAIGDYLLVDRASFGDPHFVQLVWNGHGRRGKHRVPDGYCDRWEKISHYTKVYRWEGCGERVILCGQTDTWSPKWTSPERWYGSVANATHFRKHPAGDNPTRLPLAHDWSNARLVVTLNSSVGVESVLNGIPTVTMDEGAMAWDVTGHLPGEVVTPNRDKWLEWLAWTQWQWDEIEKGEPIRHLFEEL